MALTAKQRARFARQIALPEIGARGQERLRTGRVLIVGAGGLGSPAALYLAAAGVGTLGLVDDDRVELSNLQRQVLHRTPDIGRLKVRAAARKLRALHPCVTIHAIPARLTAANAPALIAAYDFVVDATDNFRSKFLIADACHAARKPYSHAGVAGFIGQTMTVLPGKTACYRCVFGKPPVPAASDRRPRGPLGVVPGVLGTIQASEALKHLLGIGDLLVNRLLVFDALAATFRIVPVRRNQRCLLCGRARRALTTSYEHTRRHRGPPALMPADVILRSQELDPPRNDANGGHPE